MSGGRPAPTGLRLLAEDEEDLKILSAAVQDSILRLGDLNFDARGRAFTAALNRFRWEGERPERVRAMLRFDGVLAARSQNLRQGADEAIVDLLAVEFAPGEPPGGDIRLILAGGGEMRLAVEQIEARLMDVSDPWPARRRPEHGDG